MRYSVQLRARTFVNGYGFLSFAKNMGKNTGKNISQILSGKYLPGILAMRQKLLYHTKQSEQCVWDCFKGAIQKHQKQLVTWLLMKLLIKSLKFQKLHNKIIQRHYKWE